MVDLHPEAQDLEKVVFRVGVGELGRDAALGDAEGKKLLRKLRFPKR